MWFHAYLLLTVLIIDKGQLNAHIGLARQVYKVEFSGSAELTIDNWQLTMIVSLRDDLEKLRLFSSKFFLFKGNTAQMRLRPDGGAFPPSAQFGKQEIHQVFLCFPNFRLRKNPTPPALAELCGVAQILSNASFKKDAAVDFCLLYCPEGAPNLSTVKSGTALKDS